MNTLDLHDEYLRGLGEMPSSWPAAALQAQVDAARSYALVKYARGLHAVCNCEIDSGNGPFHDQNFVGYSKESGVDGNLWDAAVAATDRGPHRAEVVTYGGAVAETFYFASSGGRTENAVDVWGTAVPYLRSVDDHWSTEARYNPVFAHWPPATRSEAAVAAAFGLPDVVRIRFTAHRRRRCQGGRRHRALGAVEQPRRRRAGEQARPHVDLGHLRHHGDLTHRLTAADVTRRACTRVPAPARRLDDGYAGAPSTV